MRPITYFKSLSGQVERVKQAFPRLRWWRADVMQADSDRDLGDFIAGCLDDESRWNRILPIGGPGDVITPYQQGEYLFALLGKPPKFRHVPVAMLDAIVAVPALAGRVIPALADKAEFARIGRYYATKSMLVLDPETGRYDAAVTPSTENDTLFDYYARLISGAEVAKRGDHAVF